MNIGRVAGFASQVQTNNKRSIRFGQTSEKTFHVQVQMHGPNKPLVHPEATSTYVKGANGVGFYCIREKDGTTVKYPMSGIYRVFEKENPTETN